MTAIPAAHDDRRLFVADVGGALTGGSREGRQKLMRRLRDAREAITLVYASGLALSEQLRAVKTHALVLPDYIISSVGTEIHRLPGEHPLDDWYRHIQAGFDRAAVVDFVRRRHPHLELQPEPSQTPLKVSYFVPDASAGGLDQLQSGLAEAGLAAKVIYSSDLYLDLIPERAGLGQAVKYLADALALPPAQVFVSGDSGNDIDLFQYGFQGVVVSNASHELKAATRLRAYFSPKPHAEGLLDGLEHFGFFSAPPAEHVTDITREALARAIDSLRRNLTPSGFSAASHADNPLAEEDSNYFAVWSRDGIKAGLWTLCLNDPDLTDCFRRTLEVLAKHQSPAGQIPANVRLATGSPDYGGIGDIASIDSVIWFVIGACRFAAHQGDRHFAARMYPHLERAMTWLRAHDSNNCGLLEIPESSDWMDLFPRSYNVLYDEVLWYLACRDFSVIQAVMGADGQAYAVLADNIRKKILRQFWPTARKLSEARESFSETQFTLGDAQYLLAQISPFGFSWRCDVYANLLAALVGLLDERKLDQLFHFLWGVGANAPYPVKCLYPPVHSGASDWKDYFITNFLNLPDHYHNGGVWPFIGGLWVRFLARTGRKELAHQELGRLAEACRLGVYGEWEFNEWLHGQTGRPMGKAHQAWSAAGYVAAYAALHHDAVPADFAPLSADMFGAPSPAA